MDIGEKIAFWREKRNLTQQQLGELLDVTSKTVWRWENGEREVKYGTLEKIASALNLELPALLNVPSNPKHQNTFHRDYDLVTVPVLSKERTACCGEGITALDITTEPEDILHIPREMLGIVDDLRPPYAQRTDGTSMAGYGVSSGSIVVINPAADFRSGDIGLVCLGDDEAIKKVIFKPDRIELHSDGPLVTVENEDMQSNWFRIIGKVVATWATPKHGL